MIIITTIKYNLAIPETNIPESSSFWVALDSERVLLKICQSFENSLAVQWLGLGAFTAKGLSSIPGQGMKIPQSHKKQIFCMKRNDPWLIILYTMTFVVPLLKENNMLISCYYVKGVDLFQSNPGGKWIQNSEKSKRSKKSTMAIKHGWWQQQQSAANMKWQQRWIIKKWDSFKFWKRFLNKLNTELPCDSEIPLLGIYSK